MRPGFPPEPTQSLWMPDALAARGARLRWLTAQDLHWLRELYAGTREDEMAAVPWTPAQKRHFLDQQFDAQHRHYLQRYGNADFLAVCDLGDRPLGRLYLQRTTPAHLIVDVSLFPHARGQGLGTALIAAIQRQAMAQGCGVMLHVLQQNRRARRLYERLGFVAGGGRAPPYLRMDWEPARVS